MSQRMLFDFIMIFMIFAMVFIHFSTYTVFIFSITSFYRIVILKTATEMFGNEEWK